MFASGFRGRERRELLSNLSLINSIRDHMDGGNNIIADSACLVPCPVRVHGVCACSCLAW